MIPLAVSTPVAVLSLLGLALGAVVLALVVGLFNRVVGAALEIRAYADHILGAGLGIARNVDAVDELARTRELATAVPDLAGSYLERVKGRLS